MPRKKIAKKEEPVVEAPIVEETIIAPLAEVVEEIVIAEPSEKESITNDEFLQAEPQTFTDELCKKCNGAGLARPGYVNSEFCANCKGTGREPMV